jgi:hypothetical protein
LVRIGGIPGAMKGRMILQKWGTYRIYRRAGKFYGDWTLIGASPLAAWASPGGFYPQIETPNTSPSNLFTMQSFDLENFKTINTIIEWDSKDATYKFALLHGDAVGKAFSGKL